MIDTPVAIDVPLRADKDGVIRVGKSRVTLLTIINRYSVGDSPEAIHDGFPSVPLADIYAVIAYYLGNRDEVDEYIRQIEAAGENFRREYETENPQARQ